MDERRAELMREREKRIEAVRERARTRENRCIGMLLQGETVEDDDIEQTLASEFQVLFISLIRDTKNTDLFVSSWTKRRKNPSKTTKMLTQRKVVSVR